MYYNVCRRYFIRHYIYTILCLIFFIFLLKWNLIDKEKKKANLKSLHSNANFLYKYRDNIIFLTLYIESRCPDTTNFMKHQLKPTFEKLKDTNRVNYSIIPFGKADCNITNNDYICTCQHGESECLLNQLMNCVINRSQSYNDFVPIIICIQGLKTLDEAFQNCLSNNKQAKELIDCAKSKSGRRLHWLAGKKTKELGPQFNFVPWIVINGKRVNDAFYALEENLCQRLNAPKPFQCK